MAGRILKSADRLGLIDIRLPPPSTVQRPFEADAELTIPAKGLLGVKAIADEDVKGAEIIEEGHAMHQTLHSARSLRESLERDLSA